MAKQRSRAFAPAEDVRHPALEAQPASPLAEARLSDQQRLGVLLQGAALLAHLEQAAWRLPRGWKGAGVDDGGRLAVAEVLPERSRVPAQDLLRDLLERLFGPGPVSGRGEARRAARELAKEWRHSLVAVSADRAVARILEAAPFLWRRRFAPARRALVAEHRRGGRWRSWVAGPGASRRRLLAAAAGRRELEELVAGSRAREAWEGSGSPDPSRLAAAGRWRAAVRAWTRRPPRAAAERLELADALYALGQFEKAAKAISGLRSPRARLLRTWCQLRLGQLQAARAAIRRLADAELTAAETVELAAVAVRVLANLGEPEQLGDWVARARAAARGRLVPRSRLLAAFAAWDVGDREAMSRHLETARSALEIPELAWRWHFAASLAANAAGDPGKAREHLTRALTEGRRRLRRFEAGELWNEMGICRARLGDLGGAERAFLHTLRLLGRCEGPRRTTLALYNLAEIRLRRGRLIGVRAILEEATLENRLSRNLRGSIQDAELWARFDLAHGRPGAALAHCREALERLDRRRLEWRRAALQVLAARALGWLGRPSEAAAALGATDAVAREELEAEERPALWALAGDREAALAAAATGPFGGLWQGLLTGRELPARSWDVLAELEPYRAARLVFDADLLAPGSAPPHWLRRSIAALRRVGAAGLAERLEVRDTGPWQALATYLAKTPAGDGGAAGAGDGLSALFQQAGYPEASLSWSGAEGEVVLVAGPGGGEVLAAPVAGGRLELAAPWIDPVLRGLFALALRDLALAPLSQTEGRPPDAGGMIGQSPALTRALERLALLAPGEMPVLILGESGTGKELAARLVHRGSPRSERPLLAINCAALSETLLLSDLFGHVRGSFTGADRDRAGVFETAQGGTVFLDEIGDLPASAQGMLLRVLQEGEVRRVGESVPRRVEVRVVAATHRKLEAMVAAGDFRQDLFFRLKVATVELPPLRERGGDVLLLAEHFLSRPGRDGKVATLTPAARKQLQAHDWPGNVRELENVLQVARALAAGASIKPEHLDLPRRDAEATAGDYHREVEAFRRRLVAKALDACDGNRAEAARRLGLSRQALSYLVRQLKLL